MRIRIVDAFAEQAFAGNPAGVVVLPGDGFPADDWMLRVAGEVNHSETAFVHRLPEGGDADWALRWFTPAVEVNLCGHATLATTHVLARSEKITEARYATRSGVLVAHVAPDGAITMDFPTESLTAVPTDPALAEAFGVPILGVHLAGPNTSDLIVEVADEATVRAVVPDMRGLAGVSKRGIAVTALAGDSGGGYDFVSRLFAPGAGVDEDPVTGSLHAALAPYWGERLGRTELTGFQASARGGLVRVTLLGDRTLIAGRAVTVIDGELLP
ncbi:MULTISPECIES: PhzF family phenazine biosynthesis protein [Actinoplanes]|uniref:PhzF family phenazine biosynthesis protein n=1 Tax=Actinoplanes TaxID=1865 RepID=UPI0005F2A5B7|nr:MULTISPECIES: PhzF family phenazine biosynthesis protein [Actinoplanes]GLY03613.1 oxidoreductase [Actinoplanes sp. NBRC 101535]